MSLVAEASTSTYKRPTRVYSKESCLGGKTRTKRCQNMYDGGLELLCSCAEGSHTGLIPTHTKEEMEMVHLHLNLSSFALSAHLKRDDSV